MQAKTLGLSWIAVKDLKKAIQFYQNVLGLKVVEMCEEWGWAELEGHEGGTRLGLAQYQDGNEECPIAPGQNAIFSILVENIEQARQHLEKNGAKLVGEVQEIPGHVKMQLLRDNDDNFVHLVETVEAEQTVPPKHEHGCCGGH